MSTALPAASATAATQHLSAGAEDAQRPASTAMANDADAGDRGIAPATAMIRATGPCSEGFTPCPHIAQERKTQSVFCPLRLSAHKSERAVLLLQARPLSSRSPSGRSSASARWRCIWRMLARRIGVRVWHPHCATVDHTCPQSLSTSWFEACLFWLAIVTSPVLAGLQAQQGEDTGPGDTIEDALQAALHSGVIALAARAVAGCRQL